MFLRSLSRDYILLMNNSIEMHSAQIIGKVFKNIYRNQDLSFALIKLLSKIKCIYCNPLTAFQEKKRQWLTILVMTFLLITATHLQTTVLDDSSFTFAISIRYSRRWKGTNNRLAKINKEVISIFGSGWTFYSIQEDNFKCLFSFL